jgi:hypothetical protein
MMRETFDAAAGAMPVPTCRCALPKWAGPNRKEVIAMSDPTAREQENDGEDHADSGGAGYDR